MASPPEFDNTIAREYRQVLTPATELEYIERTAFYAQGQIVGYAVSHRVWRNPTFANILLTVGPTLV